MDRFPVDYILQIGITVMVSMLYDTEYRNCIAQNRATAQKLVDFTIQNWTFRQHRFSCHQFVCHSAVKFQFCTVLLTMLMMTTESMLSKVQL